MALAAHGRKLYAKSASTAPSGSDEIDGITDCSVDRSRESAETTDYKSDEYKTRIALLADAGISISGDVELADSPQNLIRSNFIAGTTFYFTHLVDGTNGYTFPVLCTAYSEKGAVGDKATFDATLELNGTPIARP